MPSSWLCGSLPEGAQAVEGAIEAAQHLGRRERVGALWRLDLHRMVARRVLLMMRGPGDEGGGHEQARVGDE